MPRFLYAQLGGLPTRNPELPIIAIFITVYCAAWLYCLQDIFRRIRGSRNSRIAVILFLACGERIIAYMMRIVWMFRISNIGIGVASQILLQAGVILLYVGTLLSAVSLLTVHFGKLPWLTTMLVSLSTMTITLFIANLVSTIVSVYTPQEHVWKTCRKVQRIAATYLVFLTFVSVSILVVIFYIRWKCRKDARTQSKQMSTCLSITFASIVCLFMAGFRAALIWKDPSPLFSTTWYLSLTCLYCFEMGPELFVTLTLIATNALSALT